MIWRYLAAAASRRSRSAALFSSTSALFHYLGPAFAVLLFAHVTSTRRCVASYRKCCAGLCALATALAHHPCAVVAAARGFCLRWACVLGLMNVSFYEAISRLPLSTVGAIEFIGPVALAALGARTPRNIASLALAASGGWILTGIRFGGEPLGYLFAFANCALFMLYVVLGHRIAQDGDGAAIDRLAWHADRARHRQPDWL